MDNEPMDGAMEDLVVLLPALLRTLEALAFISRFFNPPEFVAAPLRIEEVAAHRRQAGG